VSSKGEFIECMSRYIVDIMICQQYLNGNIRWIRWQEGFLSIRMADYCYFNLELLY